jgi:hypothetical protein
MGKGPEAGANARHTDVSHVMGNLGKHSGPVKNSQNLRENQGAIGTKKSPSAAKGANAKATGQPEVGKY